MTTSTSTSTTEATSSEKRKEFIVNLDKTYLYIQYNCYDYDIFVDKITDGLLKFIEKGQMYVCRSCKRNLIIVIPSEMKDAVEKVIGTNIKTLREEIIIISDMKYIYMNCVYKKGDSEIDNLEKIYKLNKISPEALIFGLEIEQHHGLSLYLDEGLEGSNDRHDGFPGFCEKHGIKKQNLGNSYSNFLDFLEKHDIKEHSLGYSYWFFDSL